MFTRIARRYDLMNSLMTGGRHHAWRRRVADAVADAPAGPVLDLATGTADLAIAVRARDPRRFVAGADFSEGMLRVGQAKLDARGLTRTRLLVADALALPFRDGAFACVMSAFLLRNLEDLQRGLAEMRRVTMRGGSVVTLDIVRPALPVWGTVFGSYFNHVVPAIGAGRRPPGLHLPAPVRRALRHARRAGADDGEGRTTSGQLAALRPRDDRAPHRRRLARLTISAARALTRAP